MAFDFENPSEYTEKVLNMDWSMQFEVCQNYTLFSLLYLFVVKNYNIIILILANYKYFLWILNAQRRGDTSLYKPIFKYHIL